MLVHTDQLGTSSVPETKKSHIHLSSPSCCKNSRGNVRINKRAIFPHPPSPPPYKAILQRKRVLKSVSDK